MFGSVRLFLAACVVISHLPGNAYLSHFGFYAVWGFFIISGFQITAGLNDVYQFDGVRFWANRFLRLVPSYYTVCSVTLALVLLFPDQAGNYHSAWDPDPDLHTVLMDFTILPLQMPPSAFRAFPPYWSVAVELIMYFSLWVFVARKPAFAGIALVAGAAYHAACIKAGFFWNMRYMPAPAALLPFALGALIYFTRESVQRLVGPKWTIAAFAGWAANVTVGGLILPADYIYGAGYYFNVVTFAVIVMGLSNLRESSWAKLDHAVGRFAYPVFLMQWLAGFSIYLILNPAANRSWTITVLAVPVILAGAWGLVTMERHFVDPLRLRIRDSLFRLTALYRVLNNQLSSRRAAQTAPSVE